MMKLNTLHSSIRLEKQHMECNCITVVLQMDGSSTGRAKFLSIHTYSCSCICHGYCFLLFSASTSNLPHSTRFLILHKGVPTANSRKRKPWAKLGKKPVSSRRHEDSDEAAGPCFYHFYTQNDLSRPFTFTCCTAEPAPRTGSGQNLDRFEAFFIQQQ